MAHESSRTDAGAAHFDQAGERFGGPHQQPAAGAFKMDAVVADQPWQSAKDRRAPASMRSSASRDLPAPDGPRISTARAPTSTAEA